jgi:heterodisulfide reductase subunit A
LGQSVAIGRKVVIIGGGNVAIDCARTCWRLGAEEVIILYRRTRAEMPASEWEIEEAEHEGVTLQFLAAPTRLLGENGRLTSLEYQRMELGRPDESGRRRPVPLEGSETVMSVDTVVPAIGQTADSAMLETLGLDVDRWSMIRTDEDSLVTSRPNVFAGGDCSLGAASFVEAVAHGRRAARSIHHHLAYGGLRPVEGREPPLDLDVTEEERARARDIQRQEMPVLPVKERRQGFEEVELGFTAEMARAEGERCLSCSVCCQCGECARNCGPQAIDLNARERIRELDVGAVVVATGIDIFDARRYPEYGFGRYPDVITNLQFERMCNASGPTKGRVIRPSTGQVPQSVVFVQCVGSRDPAKGNAYCSKVCCMITAKQLSIFKHHNHDGQAYVFYIDNRTGGKGYEEFLRRGMEQEKAQYIRGRVAKVYEEGGRLVVRGENSLAGGPVEIEADLVVLATGLVARDSHMEVARALNLSTDKDGFFIELHPKLGPVETALSGIYLAGAAQGPKDIPESVAQGGGAAAEVLALFGQGEVEVEPTVASVDTRLCTGCKTCVGLCAYSAISFDEAAKTASINEALCQGCGTCGAACPVAAIHIQHYTPDQLFAQIEGILA